MCLTYFTILDPQHHHKYRFVMAFNRDEQSHRQTLPFGPFTQDPNILAGRDIISKGTWLGINIKVGVVVILTNYDEEVKQYGRSRGKLVYHFLSTKTYGEKEEVDERIRKDLKETLKVQKEYSAFNIIVYSVKSNNAYYINSKQGMQEPRILLKNSHYGLCNVDIDTLWPKTQHGLNLYTKVMSENMDEQPKLLSSLDKLMRDDKSFNADPNQQASIFVNPYFCTTENAERRTKSTTLILVSQQLEVTVREITHGVPDKQVNYHGQFKLQSDE